MTSTFNTATDLNTTNAPTEEQLQALATQPAAPAGPTIVEIAAKEDNDQELIDKLQTFTNAKRIKAGAARRIEKAEAAIKADERLIERIAAVIEQLPESSGTSTPAVVAAKVGDEVTFRRIKRGAGSQSTDGVIVAIKEASEGVAAQLRVQVGEGFDMEFINIFPGQVEANKSVNPEQGELNV